MSATLNLGTDGNWATKKDTILAYNDENSNFKPLPFSFDRDTLATRINKEGLIETVGSGEPRIDYKDDSKGALLLEPQRTNYILKSNNFSALSGGFATPNYGTSPEGLSVSRILFTNANQSMSASTSLSTGVVCNFSAYVKGVKGEFIKFAAGGVDIAHTFSGEWERLSGSATSINNSWNLNTYGYTTARDFLICGAQLEQGSYPTSYIPTQGSIGTRVAETCSQTVPSGIIGQTEGVIFLDVKMPSVIQSSTTFSIGGGASGEYAQLEIRSDLSINWRYRQGNTDYINANVGSYVGGDRLKLAFAYKSGSSVLYKNGLSIAVDNGSIGANSWNNVYFSNYAGTGKLNANVNQMSLYNTRLSNSELQALTTI